DGSYAIGDWLTVYSDHFPKPMYGRVIGITWRSTYLRLEDGRMLMIPNHMATANAVTNHCSPPGPKRLSFEVPIDYRVPAPRAIALMTGEACKAVRTNPQLARTPEPEVIVNRILSDSTIFEVRFYADPEKIFPDIAQSIIGAAVHEAVIRLNIPSPVTQI